MTASVCVVGAGVSGCAAARALAPDFDVTVVDRAGVAAGTTARAAGLVTLAPAYADAPAVPRHAAEFFRAYDGTRGFAYEEVAGLGLIAEGGGETARLRVDRLRGEGVDVAFLDPAAVRERFPRSRTDPLDGGVRHGGVGVLDPRALAASLAADAEARGATFRTGTEVTGLAVDGGAVRGVRVDAGGPPETLRADAVVVAAGWRTEPLLRDAVTLPVRPYRTQCVVLDPPTPAGDGFPVGWIPAREVYFRPRADGRVLVGGGAAATDDPAGASRGADPAFRDRALTALADFFEGFDGARVAEGWAGVDCGTPDARPVVDAPADAPDGLVVAAGFHGKGVMTAPVTASLVRELVAEEVGAPGEASAPGEARGADGDDADLPREAFSLARFDADSRSPDFRFVSIAEGEGEGEEGRE